MFDKLHTHYTSLKSRLEDNGFDLVRLVPLENNAPIQSISSLQTEEEKEKETEIARDLDAICIAEDLWKNEEKHLQEMLLQAEALRDALLMEAKQG